MKTLFDVKKESLSKYICVMQYLQQDQKTAVLRKTTNYIQIIKIVIWTCYIH